jgi:hypothetical protein
MASKSKIVVGLIIDGTIYVLIISMMRKVMMLCLGMDGSLKAE